MSDQENRINRKRTVAVIAAVGVVGALGAGVLLARSGGLAPASDTAPTFVVQRGPLTISVIEAGTIKSQEQVVLKNEVEGQVTLIYLIPEGTRVQPGELLAELDASQLQDNRVEQQIRLENSKAAYISARENLEVVRNQAASDTSKAQLDFDFAEEDAEKYEQGDLPQLRTEADSKITIASEEMNRAKEKLKWSERLFDEEYLSLTELESDRLTFKRAELEYDLAVKAKDLLENYTARRQRAQLQSDIEQAKLALERAKLKASADVVQAEADLKAKDAEYKQQQAKLTKLDEQISKAKITAPREGLVVYATSTRGGGRGGMTQPLEEGQTVRERQELIYLPSSGSMMAELMIHESSLDKVAPGQPVRISVDAMPGREFQGRVRSIAPLPDAQSAFMNPDRKVYATRVFLDGDNPELRTGMSCRAEIIVQELPDAVFVPTFAVVRVDGIATAFVKSGRTLTPRPVEVGLDNTTMIHVISGLTQGEVVSLTPPLETRATGGGTTASQRPAPPAQNGPAAASGAGPTSGPARGPGARGESNGEAGEDRAEQRRRRMESMTPEQREEMQRRMRDRGGDGSAPRGPRGAGGGEGQRPGRSRPSSRPADGPE
ncbi:MAG: efflux RND transporter periplasmic adaptor subunit [Phycisphaerales bacterium]|nr:efflux RND transporter periplasmic adaptor subunit [Phycisphaerales bacterium]